MKVETKINKLQANSKAIERWQRKLFRAATELKKLTEQRKRLLRARAGQKQIDHELNDQIPKEW